MKISMSTNIIQAEVKCSQLSMSIITENVSGVTEGSKFQL